MKFEIGPGVECDLDTLLRSRLLIQAMSGAGKSWLIRRLLEQTVAHVQQFVIDCEGDCKTLREKFPYVLVATEGGDALASPATARPMAVKLLELGISAILDISGLGIEDQETFVTEFLQGLIHAPQSLWHDALIVLDEAQRFCPQGRKSDSKTAVNNASGLVRKRGFGLVLATNRISGIDKATSEMCENKLIGRSMFVDAARGAKELGLSRDEQTEMRSLANGEFYAFGPAVGHEVRRLIVGPVQTTHPSPGGRRVVAPPPPEQVRAILGELAQLAPALVAQSPGASRQAEKAAKPCDHDKELRALQDKVAAQEADLAHMREYGQQALRERDEWKGKHAAAASELAAFADLKRAFAVLGAGEGVALASVDEDGLVERVIARLPANGAKPLQITPPEALRKEYLQVAVERLLGQLSAIGADSKAVVRLLLGQPGQWPRAKIVTALSGVGAGGGAYKKWEAAFRELELAGLVKRGGRGGSEHFAPSIRESIERELGPHGATAEEVAAVENQVIYRLVEA